MRLFIVPMIIAVLIGLLMVWYAVRRWHTKKGSGKILATACGCIAALLPVVVICLPIRSGSETTMTVAMWLLYTWLSIFLSGVVALIFDLIGRMTRLKAISKAGLCIGILVFGLMWWGALINRNRLQVQDVTIKVADLPTAFNGFRIVQISDFHSAGFGGNTAFAEKAVEKINSLRPDIIVFTGDIVSTCSEELRPFVPVLKGLHAPMGIYSVMGNHDYGDYHSWPSPDCRLADIENLHKMQSEMGWRLLDNEHVVLHRGADSLVVIGVENVGDPPFHTYGDLDEAYPTLDDPVTKILLTHNPAHWTIDIKDSPDKNIVLTLSGHTHAMQIELFGLSPAAWRYDTWGGLYSDDSGHNLYVNIGLGEVGFPARIGATPEITLITLEK